MGFFLPVKVLGPQDGVIGVEVEEEEVDVVEAGRFGA